MKSAISALVLLALAACAQAPHRPLPTPEPAPHWRAGPAADTDGSPWWKAFGDPRLDALQAQALSNNLDLQQAQERLEQARQAAGLAQAALAPAAYLDASAGRVQQSLNAGLGVLANVVPGYARMADPGQLGLSASWELDFAGGLRHQRQAAQAQAQASAAELQALRLALSAELADAYFAAWGASLQKAALARQLELLHTQSRTLELRVRVGAASSIELNHFMAGVAEASVPLAALTAGIAVQKNRMAVLLGRDPSRWDLDFSGLGPMALADDPFGGLPADMLRRRPDVLAAQLRLEGAGARVAASMAEYYPRFSLSAALGQDSSNYANLESSRSSFAQTFLGLRWRLFDFGRIDAEVRIAEAGEREALLAYRAAVLRAAEDVETRFSQLAGARERLKKLQEQGDRVRWELQSTRHSYQAGAVSQDDVHTAERGLAKNDFDRAAAEGELARAIVLAARALGGPVAD